MPLHLIRLMIVLLKVVPALGDARAMTGSPSRAMFALALTFPLGRVQLVFSLGKNQTKHRIMAFCDE